MKKREMTTTDLEQLFNKIIEQKPLINEEQVNSLLNNLPKASSGNAIKQFIQNHLNMLILGIIVLSIVLGVALWGNSSHKTEKPAVQNIKQENELKPVSNDTIAVKPAVNIVKKAVQGLVPEDTSLKTTSSEISQTDTILSVSDLYKYFDKKPQLFSIQANRDTTIICGEGTSIKIKANSFISEKTGKVISGKVQLAVKEYYKLSDIILSNLSTTSGNQILETGGMLQIEAISDNENCLIKQGSNLEIGFPYSDKKENMALFNGKWTNDKIEWTPDKKKSEEIVVDSSLDYTENNTESPMKSEAYIIVEEMAEFPGGEDAMRKYIAQNVQYPYSALENKIYGSIFIHFLINESGSLTNISVLQGINNVLDKAAFYLVNNMPNWKPAKQAGKPVPVEKVIVINYPIKNEELTEQETSQSKDFEEKIKDVQVVYKKNYKDEFESKVNDGNLHKTTLLEINNYFLSVSKLGWINCDRVLNYSSRIADYSVRIDQADKAIVTLIFQQFNAILPGVLNRTE